MNKYIVSISVIIFLPIILKAQIITSIAGNGVGGDGTPAVSALVQQPEYLTFDRFGNLFFTQYTHKIRKIDAAGIITTIGGTGSPGFSGDNGPAISASFNQPSGIAVDASGDVFVADYINNRVRRIDKITGIVTTVAGDGSGSFSGDNGPAVNASLYRPIGLCFDKHGNLYVGDYGNHRIRKINTSGIISTVAGNGNLGWGGNGGLATAAMVSPSAGIFIDNLDNLYMAEWTYGVVRKVTVSGVISIVAGDTSDHSFNGDGILSTDAHLDPVSVIVNANSEIYISDNANDRIRKIDATGIIQTVAGTGIGGFSGDSGLATAAKIDNTSGLALDSCGNLYFGQVNTPRIRKVAFNPTCAPTNAVSYAAQKEEAISIFPNPTTDEIKITGADKSDINIINTVGQVLIEQKQYAGNASVNVSALCAGVYYVVVRDRVTGEKVTRRFVKN